MDTNNLSPLKDSGERRQFDTGAVRDIQVGKGRCDLLPLDVIAEIVSEDSPAAADVLRQIDKYLWTKDVSHLVEACMIFIEDFLHSSSASMMLELSIHYEQGAMKYGERNWEKGIQTHSYIDSGVRHLLKCIRRDDDEPHFRAFLWNMAGAIWNEKHRPDLVDIPDFSQFTAKAEKPAEPNLTSPKFDEYLYQGCTTISSGDTTNISARC